MKRFLYFVACLWMLCGVASAQSAPPTAPPNPTPAGPIAMEVSSPLAIVESPLAVGVRFGRWFPVAVTLSNSGEAVRGTLTLRLTAGGGDSGATSTFVAPIDLPTVARKRVWLYGRVERGESTVAEVVLQGSGFQTLGAKFDLKTLETPTRAVFTVSDAGERLAFLGGLRDKRLGLLDQSAQVVDKLLPPAPIANKTAPYPTTSNAPRPVQSLGAAHEMLPPRWIGYDSLDCVVLHDFAHSALTPAQIAALRGYVAGGGTLMVAGGADWQRLANSPLRDLWPLQPASSGVAARDTQSTLVSRYVPRINGARLSGADNLGGAPVVLMRGMLRPDARLLAGTRAEPLLVSRDFGAGRVVFSSFDPTKPPFIGWSGQGALWTDVFRQSPRAPRLEAIDARFEMPGFSPGDNQGRYYGRYNPDGATQNTATSDLFKNIITSPSLQTPPVAAIAWFLALYVFFLVPVNYCVLRALDRRELAWVTIPIIVVAFSLLSYGAAVRLKGSDVRTRLVTLVQGSGTSNLARADAMLWLFSPAKTSYEISGDDARLTVAPYFDASRDDPGETTISQPDESAPFVVRDAAINMWDYRAFIGQSVVDVGRGARVTKGGAAVTLFNDTPFDWRGAVRVSNGRVAAFGDIAAKSRAPERSSQVVVSGANINGAIESAARLDAIFPAATSGSMNANAQSLLALALGARNASQGDDFIVAWMTRAATPLEARDTPSLAQNVSLLVFRLPPDAPR